MKISLLAVNLGLKPKVIFSHERALIPQFLHFLSHFSTKYRMSFMKNLSKFKVLLASWCLFGIVSQL